MLIHPLCVVGHWQYCGNMWLWPWGLWRWNSSVFIYFYPRQIYDPGWWQKKLDQSQNSTKHYCTLFICLLYEYSKRFVQPVVWPVVQPAAKCNALWRRTIVAIEKETKTYIHVVRLLDAAAAAAAAHRHVNCRGIRVMSWWQLLARYSVTVLHCVQRLVVIFTSLKWIKWF